MRQVQGEKMDGFEGAVSGLALSDVIQLNSLNRFSGCLTVTYQQQVGLIFFRDGEIIHAECGGRSGEPAFYQVVTWPAGKFNLQPKVTTTSHSIRQSVNFLLLEAHRLMDEHKTQAEDGVTKGEQKMTGVAAKLATIPGVSYAVVLNKDGQPVSDTSFVAETLAAQGVFLSMVGNQLGSLFGTGDVKSTALQAKEQHLLLFESRGQHLIVAVRGEHNVAAVEADVRAAFAKK